MSQQSAGGGASLDFTDLPEPLEQGRLPTDSFESDGQNPNQMTDEQFEALKENIQEFGFIVPIIADRDRVIADGEHRWQAAKDLGLDEVYAIVLDVDEVDRKIVRQVMNKLQGDHDLHDDAEELNRILSTQSTSDVAGLLGQSENHIDNLVSMAQERREKTKEVADDVKGDASDATSSTQTSVDGDDADDTDAESDDTSASDDGLAPPESEPGSMDPDQMDTEHECPRCGYEW